MLNTGAKFEIANFEPVKKTAAALPRPRGAELVCLLDWRKG